MKIRPSLLAVLLLAAVPCQGLRAQDPVTKPATALDEPIKLKDDDTPPAATDTPPPVRDNLTEAVADEKKIIDALSKDEQAKVKELLGDASTFIQGIRIQEAIAKLLEAEEIAPGLYTIHNLKGAAYTKMRDFDKARVCFEKAISIAPDAFMGRFNLAETEFVTHKYDAAVKRLTPLIPLLEQQAKEADDAAADPKKPFDAAQRKNLRMQAEATRGTINLIQFKLLICALKMGDPAGATAIQKKFNRFSDDPSFYYGHAAMHYEKADQLKGDEKAMRTALEEAQGWLQSAQRIYNPQQLAIYTDSLIEAGWIENLQ